MKSEIPYRLALTPQHLFQKQNLSQQDRCYCDTRQGWQHGVILKVMMDHKKS